MSTAIGQMTYRHRRYLYGPSLVDATGSQRRLRALARLGWSVPALERRAGLARWALDGVLTSPRVHRGRAELISWLYGELWDREAPLLTSSQRYSSARAKSAAEKAGWPPPMGWDDDEIDIPARPLPRQSRRQLSPCGTPAAARRHYRRGEPTCASCRTAERQRWTERMERETA
jgi:hypothetical protein